MEALKRVFFDGLPIAFQPWQVLYVMALFLVLVFVLNRLLYSPVLAVLTERAKRIEEGRGAADESTRRIAEKERQVGEKLARARTDSVQRLDAAKTAAEDVRSSQLGTARGEAQERVEKARAVLDEEAAEAERQLAAEAHHVGTRIASRLLGREVA